MVKEKAILSPESSSFTSSSSFSFTDDGLSNASSSFSRLVNQELILLKGMLCRKHSQNSNKFWKSIFDIQNGFQKLS
jgi:hypothetical protein